MQKKIIILILLSSSFLCSCDKTYVDNSSLVNTNHLEQLYQEININGNTLGTIWIYCNAPNYEVVTDDDEGYTCVDDVSRALIFYCRQYKIKPDAEYLKKIKSLTNFILYMKADNGYFYNFMFPNDEINIIHQNSIPTPNFWSWRALWALSELNMLESPKLNDLKNKTIPVMDELIERINQQFSKPSEITIINGINITQYAISPGADQLSIIIVALTNYYQINKSTMLKDLILNLDQALTEDQFGNKDTFPYYAFMSWKNKWHAWGNMQAYALLYSGKILQDETLINAGLNEVKYFYPYCIKKGFIHKFSIVNNNDSLVIDDYSQFPQIAYCITPMIYASLEAYAITKDNSFAKEAGDLATWFFGNNPANQIIYNTNSGIAFDGIDSANNINYNSGAESTIEALLSMQAIETNEIAKQVIKNYQ
ncbi:MAG: hypothetical protein DRJ01_02515 [Bacteroidetes bacterium]|nr:MAG: hypothetical protein DRJ01_02515 [Bacteroidota bacterium]